MTAVKRSFLLGRLTGEAVLDDRRDTLELLALHDRLAAQLALASSSSFTDFFRMRERMLAGGLHRVRLTGGRGIDR